MKMIPQERPQRDHRLKARMENEYLKVKMESEADGDWEHLGCRG